MIQLGWSDQIFLSNKKIIFCSSLKVVTITHKKYHASCFMYLSEILSKLQTCEVTNFMTFSDGLLIYDFFI